MIPLLIFQHCCGSCHFSLTSEDKRCSRSVPIQSIVETSTGLKKITQVQQIWLDPNIPKNQHNLSFLLVLFFFNLKFGMIINLPFSDQGIISLKKLRNSYRMVFQQLCNSPYAVLMLRSLHMKASYYHHHLKTKKQSTQNAKKLDTV